jgi:serine/threonine-protein kinase RsbW
MIAEPDSVFEKRFVNQLPELIRVTEEGVRFLEQRGISTKAVDLARLAIEEMATNILKYGYDDDAVHYILLRVQIELHALLIAIEDDGHEFNPIDAPQPDLHLPIEEREPGGLGIHLVRKLAAHMDYQRCGGRNRLRITIAF